MIFKWIFTSSFAFILLFTYGQDYTSYLTGNSSDVTTSPLGGICLMGGATEDDNAMKWFLEQANGGDVLVLRTSGSDGYNNYLYASLGVPVHSVETIVCHSPNASFNPYVLQRIEEAEAIWFAGGNQWTYVSYWRDTPVDSLINLGIGERNIVVGGTSAGMAIQGGWYFSAQFGTVTSATVLSDPFDQAVTVDSAGFISHDYLDNLITDTHFDNPDRRGRLLGFLARMSVATQNDVRAIACDEYTAVCIDSAGVAKVFGGYPAYDDYAYFIQENCAIENNQPEICQSGNPLTWNQNSLALQVYRINGNSAGDRIFDLNDWKTASGGEWLFWSAEDGVFNQIQGSVPDCPIATSPEDWVPTLELYPNPVQAYLTLHIPASGSFDMQILSFDGKVIRNKAFSESSTTVVEDVSQLGDGLYMLRLVSVNGSSTCLTFVKVP
jgi:cyanophycinase-like exopeptidase